MDISILKQNDRQQKRRQELYKKGVDANVLKGEKNLYTLEYLKWDIF